MYDVHHELPNNLRIRSLGDEEISKCLELMMTPRKPPKKQILMAENCKKIAVNHSI